MWKRAKSLNDGVVDNFRKWYLHCPYKATPIALQNTEAMDFDWANPPFDFENEMTTQDIEESFEDPFAVKLLPDSARFGVQARFFNLGRAASGVGVFSLYRANGRNIRVIFSRQFSAEEQFFYQRKMNQVLAQ